MCHQLSQPAPSWHASPDTGGAHYSSVRQHVSPPQTVELVAHAPLPPRFSASAGGPVAEIIEVGSPGNRGGRRVRYALETGGEAILYGSLDEAMRAAKLPAPSPTGDQVI